MPKPRPDSVHPFGCDPWERAGRVRGRSRGASVTSATPSRRDDADLPEVTRHRPLDRLSAPAESATTSCVGQPAADRRVLAEDNSAAILW